MIPIQPLSPEEYDAFWGKAAPDGTGCLVWTGYIDPSGYARYEHRGQRIRVHRIAYVDTHGSIPDGTIIDHLCRNRACINPDHLEAVDNWTNVRRGTSPVALNWRKTHCKRGHEFTPENTIIPAKRPGQRHCRRCKNGEI